MNWTYYNPSFTMDSCSFLSEKFTSRGAWSGHRKFGYDLVRFKKPLAIVELGTHSGASFFSFCQAVKDEGLPTQCFAIDTWKGDRHTGLYGEEIYQAVSRFTDEEYKGIGTLIRRTFDESLGLFQDDSIDLLHIDGYHTFQSVLHDYTTWHRKLKINSIVLFHDINVRRDDFGVYKLWEGLKQYPHLEFEHCFGLGVLFPKGYHESFSEILKKNEELVNLYK